MIDAGWTGVAAIAAAVSALAALVSIWLVGGTARDQARALEFNASLEANRQLADAQRRVRDAPPDHKDFELRELFNLMETLALLVNGRRMPPSARQIVEPFLIQAYAFANGDSEMTALLGSSVTGRDTYGELVKFVRRHARHVEGLTQAYHGDQIPELPLDESNAP